MTIHLTRDEGGLTRKFYQVLSFLYFYEQGERQGTAVDR